MFINNTDQLDKERADLLWEQASVHYAASGIEVGHKNARKFVHDEVLFCRSEEPTELWQHQAYP